MPSTRGSRAIAYTLFAQAKEIRTLRTARPAPASHSAAMLTLLTLIGHSYGESMRVALISREYPPEVYGGAGVHVEFLVRELRKLVDVDVHCFGAPRPEEGVHAYSTPTELAEANSALRTLGTDLEIAAAVADADVLHSHTWYANLAGVLGARLHGVPHVLTAHSLEPQRPWKA